MTMLTKSAIAAAMLAMMAGGAHAQAASASRQIQVLPAPGQEQQVVQAPQAAQPPAQAAPQQAATDGAAAQPEQTQPDAQDPAPKAAPQDAKPAPKFAPVPPKVVAPKRPHYAGGYGHHGYGYASYGYAPRYRNHCH